MQLYYHRRVSGVLIRWPFSGNSNVYAYWGPFLGHWYHIDRASSSATIPIVSYELFEALPWTALCLICGGVASYTLLAARVCRDILSMSTGNRIIVCAIGKPHLGCQRARSVAAALEPLTAIFGLVEMIMVRVFMGRASALSRSRSAAVPRTAQLCVLIRACPACRSTHPREVTYIALKGITTKLVVNLFFALLNEPAHRGTTPDWRDTKSPAGSGTDTDPKHVSDQNMIQFSAWLTPSHIRTWLRG